MLNRSPSPHNMPPPRKERGLVLIISLIILVALTLAGISLIRAVDTANLIAGNLAFQQSATHSADAGFEAAVSWIQGSDTATLSADSPTDGYFATSANANPTPPNTWDQYWMSTLNANARTLPTDSAGNTVSYVIHRQCTVALPPTGGGRCASSAQAGATSSGQAEEAGEVQLNPATAIYYRITVRVAGPRNTISYVQGIFAL